MLGTSGHGNHVTAWSLGGGEGVLMYTFNLQTVIGRGNIDLVSPSHTCVYVIAKDSQGLAYQDLGKTFDGRGSYV